jgi:hypothetical protein
VLADSAPTSAAFNARQKSTVIGAGVLLMMACTPSLASGDEARQWREYARQAMSLGALPAVASDVGAHNEPHRRFARSTEIKAAVSRLALSVQMAQTSSVLGVSPAFAPQFKQGDERWLQFGESRFASSLLAPEFAAQLGQGSELRFGLTIASQRYATPGFGEMRAHSDLAAFSPLRAQQVGIVEQSFGQGVHLALESALGEQFSLGVSAQSRVDMDAFKTYRGIFTEPGDFDLPARTGVELAWQAADPLKFSVGAERVFYSDVNAFTSTALPPRFLAFLGDGSSPQFAWRDLDVYSLRAELADPVGGQWGLQLTSRQQPSPTSALLDLALREGRGGQHVRASYTRKLASAGQLGFGASYAPAQYLLGFSPVGNRYRDGSQLEVELQWSMGF